MIDSTTGAQDLGTAVGQAIRRALLRLEGCLPAKVVEVDREKGRALVLPMIQMGTVDGQKVSRALVNVPIMVMGGGGFFTSYPVAKDDLGFIYSADRDTSLFTKSQGQEDWPNTERIFSFSDGAFLPLKMFSFAIAGGVKEDGLSIQSEDGKTFITMKDGEIQIKASKLKLSGAIEHTGDSTHTGTIKANGNITGKDIIAGTLALSTHIHQTTAPGAPTGKPEGPPDI